ncbi:histidine phosphatase family protein [Bryobacter aggregatus]|uniref:histidine phosphatase family protein n=1 Tax=Bryobacter aggregatus TaxID=360054 RepID=UPI0004E26A84|nr:histidine phosphatase family protein [Bryobacter aggregatus]
MADRHELWLLRHGETEWSLSGQHTGWTDIPLTPNGEQQARNLGIALAGRPFAEVWVSPLQRARATCTLAGYGSQAQPKDNLKEWNYGQVEGLTAVQVRQSVPGWTIWKDGAPGGETIEQVYDRAGKVIEEASHVPGDVALFAHGHILRLLAANYLGLQPNDAQLFALGTATISILGWEQDRRVIRRWNQPTS